MVTVMLRKVVFLLPAIALAPRSVRNRHPNMEY